VCLVAYKLFTKRVRIDHVLNVRNLRFPSTPAPLATTANNSTDCIVTFHVVDILCRASKIFMILSFSHFHPVNHVKHGLKDDSAQKTADKKKNSVPLTFFVPGILHDGRFAKRGPSAVGRFRPLLAAKLGNRKDCFNGSQLSNTTVYPEDPCMVYYLLLHFHTFTFIYHKNQPNEGKHTIDPMGYNKIVKFMNRLIDQAQTQKTPRFCPQMSGTRRGLRIGKVWNIWIPNIPTNINWVVVLYFKLLQFDWYFSDRLKPPTS